MNILSIEEQHSYVESLLKERKLKTASELIEDFDLSLSSSIECSNAYLTSIFLVREEDPQRHFERACQLGKKEIIYLFITSGCSLDESSILCSGEIVKDLITLGASPSYKDCKALLNAVIREDVSLVDWLLRKGADTKPGIDIALEKAIQIENKEIIHRLLRSFADVNPSTLEKVTDKSIRELLLRYVILS